MTDTYKFPSVDAQTPGQGPSCKQPYIGQYYRHRILGCIVRVCGRGGFEPDTYWGSGRYPTDEKLYLHPGDGSWEHIDVDLPCLLCGAIRHVPQEWHRCDPVTRELHELRMLIAEHKRARSDAYKCDYHLASQIIEIEAMQDEDYGGITPERACEISKTLMRAAAANAEERNAVAADLADLRHNANMVVRHSWPDCDPDAIRDMENLRAALKAVGGENA